MNIIDVALEVGVDADKLFPVMALPYATFPGCFWYIRPPFGFGYRA